MPSPLRLLIATVSYGHGKEVLRLWDSLKEQLSDYNWHFIVVDQPRSKVGWDPDLERALSPQGGTGVFGVSSIPRFRLIQSRDNVGYGAGVNLAVKASPLTWDYFLLLNPDTVVPPKNLSRWLGSAITLREKSPISLGILVPRLLNFNGVEQRSVYRFVTGASYWSNHSIFAGFIKEWKKGRESMSALPDISGSAPATSDSNSIAEIDWAMGAAYLIPWSAWQAVGGFDEAYFLYAEDMDFCWRLRKKGYGIFQDTSISILHDQGSPQGTQRGMQQVMLFDGIRLFLDRTQPFSNRVIVKICILMDMALRLCGFAIPAVLSGGRGIFAVRFSASLHTAWRTLLSANSSRPPTPLKSD